MLVKFLGRNFCVKTNDTHHVCSIINLKFLGFIELSLIKDYFEIFLFVSNLDFGLKFSKNKIYLK